jgi:hypothetical protein
MHKVHPLAWQAASTDYATTHCMRCQAGWTRQGADGAKVIVCLLDREPVFANMTDCDRYEPREEPPHSLNPASKERTE